MAITSSAKRAIRVSERKHVFNLRRKDSLKNALKDFKKLSTAGEKKSAEGALKKVYKELDKSSKTGLIKKGTADRKKSRLALSLAKLK